MKNNGDFSKYEKELASVCKSTVMATDEYQKSLDPKKNRSASVSEYYTFSEKLSACVLLANKAADGISALIVDADKVNDFDAMEALNKLLEEYIHYRMYVESFLKTTETAKSSEDFLRVLNREADVMARRIIAISRKN